MQIIKPLEELGNEIDPITNFLFALKAPETKRQYPKRLEVFFNFLDIHGSLEEKAMSFYQKASMDSRWLSNKLIEFIQYQKERVQRNEISETTIPNYFKAIKLFCVMNDITVNWQKLNKGIPSGKRAAEDRAPTREEIKKLLEYPDRRIKPIVLIMISSGIRVGAFDYLKWRQIIPQKYKDGKVIAAKMLVYPGDKEEYFTFITFEAYEALNDWIEFRKWISASFSVFTIFPRIRKTKNSLIHTIDVNKSFEEYVSKWNDLTWTKLLEDYLTNIYSVSTIRNKKYKYLRISIIPFIIGFLFLILQSIVI